MRRPDFVALNVLMSEMDGWAALQAFKSDSAVAGVPVFMLAMDREREAGWVLGVAEYLSGAEDCHRLALMVSQYLPRAGDGRAGRALLVESKPDLLQLLRDLLERDGWQVSEAEDDQQATAQLEGQTPDVIVLDLMVPELDHLYFLAKLRRDSARRSVPVVFFAAKDFSSTSRQRYNDYIKQVLQEKVAEFGVFADQVCQLLMAHARRG
jgi:CheY-like chemotaxis protein